METQTLYFSSDELFEIYRTATSKVAELKESTRCLEVPSVLDKESAEVLKDRYKHRIDILTDVIAKIEPMVLH